MRALERSRVWRNGREKKGGKKDKKEKSKGTCVEEEKKGKKEKRKKKEMPCVEDKKRGEKIKEKKKKEMLLNLGHITIGPTLLNLAKRCEV